MSTNTVQSTTTAAYVCEVYGCESEGDPDPRHDCSRKGYHRDRVWTYDARGMQVRVGAVAYIDGTPEVVNLNGAHLVDNWQVLFIAENIEIVERCEMSLSLAELDGLIAMLTAARRNVTRSVKS